MPDFLALPVDQRREALAVATDQSGRPPYLLEKDIWVVWALQQMFASPLGEHLVFKGGTSLSKGHRIIRRFSEDVDLTYDIRQLIPDLVGGSENALPPNNSQAKKWRNEIDKRLPAVIAEKVVPHLAGTLEAQALRGRVTTDGSQVWIEYEAVSSGPVYVKPAVMLEFGARSTGEPSENVDIACDAAPYLTKLSFPVARPRAMVPQRTFWEKATAIHVYCRTGKFGGGDRFSRHWYDVVQMEKTGHADKAILDRDLARAVADHKSYFFAAKAANGESIDYRQAVTGGLCLVPEDKALQSLGADYRAMQEGGFFLDEVEPFERLIDQCARLQDKANRP